MTLEEAQTIAAILETADGDCESCARGLAEKMQEAFPQFIWKCGYTEESNNERFIKVTQPVSDSSSSTAV
jgi:hypothetical protein